MTPCTMTTKPKIEKNFFDRPMFTEVDFGSKMIMHGTIDTGRISDFKLRYRKRTIAQKLHYATFEIKC